METFFLNDEESRYDNSVYVKIDGIRAKRCVLGISDDYYKLRNGDEYIVLKDTCFCNDHDYDTYKAINKIATQNKNTKQAINGIISLSESEE